MTYLSKASCTAFLCILSFVAHAQIQVSFPTTRAVFQRNKSNQSTIRISGYYTASVTRIEARLQVRDAGGTATNWTTIQSNPTGGVFSGDLTGTGGWYNLDVRGMNGDQQVGAITTIERVGIGEVFVIAGQSNAQGVHQYAPNPLNDQVNCVNYAYPNDGFPSDPPTPVFTQLDNFSGFTIAPRGVGSWCWGQLGDMLVKRLNVPVMFFNAAFSGTTIRNWRDSSPNGGTAYSLFNGQAYSPRQPYINLKLGLQFYANMLGVRAVLWHQGETDNQFKTTTASYANDLQVVINQSRADYNQNISWVVSRASYGDLYGGADPDIIAAQNQIINSVSNVFAGPSTDTIQVPRKRAPLYDVDAVHFDYDGLLQVANAWYVSLSDAFFQNSNPITPALAPSVSVACAGNNNLAISINGTYASVQWESGETSSSITKGAGTYKAKVKDALGNTLFTGQIRVSDAPIAAVTSGGPPSVCIGNSLALTSNYDNVSWLNQQTGATVATTKAFSTTTAGVYYVKYQDVSGCTFTSNTLNVTVNPLPATPTVTNGKPTVFCQGDNTTLQASSDNMQYNWNNGLNSKTVTIGSSGAYFLTVTDQNGCTSAQSNTVVVTANPVPDKPVITTSGPTTFCADRTITLAAPQNVAYLWSTGATSQSVVISQSGNYTVKTTNQFGCSSVLSDGISIQVNPLPQTPSVSASGATTFCAGNQVVLNATSDNSVIWSTGQTDKLLFVSSTGNYSVQAKDQNGCLSPYSAVVAVKVNPLPNTPTILASPAATICDGDKATLSISGGTYTVFWNTGDSTQQISTTKAGTFSAKVRDANGCVSAQAGTINIDVKPIPDTPTVNIIGTYTLQAVSSTNSSVFRWQRDNTNLSAQTATIKASQSGLYTASSSIVYSQTLTCYSLPSSPVSFSLDPNNSGLSIYPNPNPNKIVTLETQKDLTNATVTIYTLQGQVIETATVPVFDDRKQLIMTGVPSGVYIIRVQSTDFDVSKRILFGL